MPESETPLAEKAFTGRFDGNGKTIKNLTVKNLTGGHASLFECISKDKKMI
ncbi:MAG: hypothetical protein IJ727_09575 [Treponema sp.]|nr:hypothetical protein [Treponema sp.]